MTAMPIPEGEQLAAVAREATASGQVAYLTDRDRRVLCSRAAGRSGRHDISERIEEILASEVAP